jgi:hypothetical protein
MGKINYARLLLSTIVAGVFYFVCDGVIHGALLGNYHMAAVAIYGNRFKPTNTAYFYFAIFDLGKGLVAMLIYVAARSRFGARAKTAVWAGVVAWLALEVFPSIQWMPFPFYGRRFLAKVIVFEFLPMVVGAVLGAWLYKESPASV